MRVLANFEDNLKIPTNSSIDNLLNGGFEKGTVTQIFGPPSSGKSNVALTLAVNVAKNGKTFNESYEVKDGKVEATNLSANITYTYNGSFRGSYTGRVLEG